MTIGVFADGKETFLRLKPSLDLAALMPDLSANQRKLDVVILHRLIIEKCLGISEEAVKKESYITYVRGRDAGSKMVRDGKPRLHFCSIRHGSIKCATSPMKATSCRRSRRTSIRRCCLA